MGAETANSRQFLHAQLDNLLDEAEKADGQINPSKLFWFALNAAYGRGVDGYYHQIGIEEVERLRKSAIETELEYQDRCDRVYTLNILVCLLKDINCLPHDHQELRGRAAGGILPARFALSPLLMDCVSALSAAGQTSSEGKNLPANDPLVMQIKTSSNLLLRNWAQIAVVQAVYYQAKRKKVTLTESRAALEPEISEKTFQRWLKQAGGAKGALVTQAKAAGKDGEVGADWMHAFDTVEFQRLYAIARGVNPKGLTA